MADELVKIEELDVKITLVDNDLFAIDDSEDLVNGLMKTKKVSKAIIQEELGVNQNTADIAALGGGITSTKTAAYTITDIDNINTILATTSSADYVITLPTVADNDTRVITLIKNEVQGAYIVTLDGEGAETINGVLGVALRGDWNSITVKSNGATWNVIDFDITYATGFINRSDWTNVHLGTNASLNTDSDIEHALNIDLRQLSIRLFMSTDGTEANSFEVYYAVKEVSSQEIGWTLYQADKDSITFQTASAGFRRVEANGTTTEILAQSWYYKIVLVRTRILA